MAQKKKPRSTAVRQALRQTKFDAKPKASKGPAVDDRPSQRGGPAHRTKKKLARAAAANAAVSSGNKEVQHTKIEGTRIQCLNGGVPVRVVLEDGKTFPTAKLRAVQAHLAKLAKKAKKASQAEMELERVHRNADLLAAGKAIPDEPIETPSLDIARTQAKLLLPAKTTGKRLVPDSTADHGGPNKKARKGQERRERLQRDHEERVRLEGREIFDVDFCFGSVVRRDRGFGCIRLSKAAVSTFPSVLLDALKKNTEVRRGEALAGVWSEEWPEGDVVSMNYNDVAQEGLDLQPGVAVLFKLFKDRLGRVGACEAVGASESEINAAEKAINTLGDSPDINGDTCPSLPVEFSTTSAATMDTSDTKPAADALEDSLLVQPSGASNAETSEAASIAALAPDTSKIVDAPELAAVVKLSPDIHGDVCPSLPVDVSAKSLEVASSA